MSKIKIIDLVNQISRSEYDLPKQIRYNNIIYKFDKSIGDYRRYGYAECLLMKDIFGNYDCQGYHNSFYNMLSDEVEIVD